VLLPDWQVTGAVTWEAPRAFQAGPQGGAWPECLVTVGLEQVPSAAEDDDKIMPSRSALLTGGQQTAKANNVPAPCLCPESGY
jgi:hypothetical protein